MNLNHTALPRAPGWLRAGLLLILLGGCGGGVDSGGTGGAAVYASGPVNGFGSVIVNGVRFDDRSTIPTDDDGVQRTLQLGMVVEVRGSAITTDPLTNISSSTASSIKLGSEILGPIDSIDVASNTLVVLGRAIDIQPTTTVFADVANGLAGLVALQAQSTQYVEVYGLYNVGLDRYTATRIELKPAKPLSYRIRGVVNGLNANTTTFNIGSLPINYGSSPVGERPANLNDGVVVRVRLNNTPDVGVRTASSLRDGVSRPDTGQHSKLEGLIDNYSATGFTIGGVTVTTGGAVIEPLGSTLGNGVRVEVEGTFDSGALAASKIEVEDSSGKPEFEFHGRVDALTSTTLTVHGIDISYDINTPLKDGVLTDLKIGANVEVKATLVNGTQLQAARIEFLP